MRPRTPFRHHLAWILGVAAMAACGTPSGASALDGESSGDAGATTGQAGNASQTSAGGGASGPAASTSGGPTGPTSAPTGGTGGGGGAGAGGPMGATGPLKAFPGAEGFGADATGGRGGDVYHVTSLGDDGPGTLRRAIDTASGPRTIVFEVGGEIKLKSRLIIDKDDITIAGQTAPGDGITIRDRSVEIDDARDIIIRFIRIRRGDLDVVANGKPSNSVGLDTVSIDDSRDVILDHVSLSWSCDEVLGIVQNQRVTVQWALIAEPLGDPGLHPYGNEHAYGLNTSANTLTLHHSLVANYVMRGPQFEANDATNTQGYDVQMEAVNNVFFDYERSGSRYTTGIEDNASAASNVDFFFHFRKNTYMRALNASPRSEIHAETKHGVSDQVKVHVAGNVGPNRPVDAGSEWKIVWTDNDDASKTIETASSSIQAQMSDAPLFATPIPVVEQSAAASYADVIAYAGFYTKRDAVDQRVIDNVVQGVYSDYLHSQNDVGGFPALSSGTPAPDADRDGMDDDWEVLHGLDPSDPADRNGDHDSDGWTNLEEYLADKAHG